MKATKPILSMLLLALLLLSLPADVGAGASRIDGWGDRTLDDLYQLGQSGDPWDIELYQGDEIRIPLTADMFTWSDNRVLVNMEAVTTRQLSSGRVKVKAKKIKGSVTLDFLQFDTDVFAGQPFIKPGGTTRTGQTAQISIIMSREFASTQDMDFEYVLYLTVDGERYEELEITLAGTLKVDLLEIDNTYNYVNMEEGLVVEATEYIPDITLDLGKGLTVNTRLGGDTRYYATCRILESRYEMKDELDAELSQLPELYPQIECIYKLETINVARGAMGSTRASITVPNDDRVFHVYSEDLRYLGTTDQELEYSDMYVLCTEPVPQLEEFLYDNYAEGEVTVVVEVDVSLLNDAPSGELEFEAVDLNEEEPEKIPSIFDFMDLQNEQ